MYIKGNRFRKPENAVVERKSEKISGRRSKFPHLVKLIIFTLIFAIEIFISIANYNLVGMNKSMSRQGRNSKQISQNN